MTGFVKPLGGVGGGGGGGGEANTASNLGAGAGLATPKVGVDLPFKSLTAGTGITLTPSASEILISGGAMSALSMYDGTSRANGTAVFADGFGGAVLNVPVAGNYCYILEGEVAGSSASSAIEIAVGKNSVTVAVADSEREIDMGDDMLGSVTTGVLLGLVPADDISGIFRKPSGAGTVSFVRKRLSLQRVI